MTNLLREADCIKHNYTMCLSEKICHQMEAEHQDNKQSRRHAGISVSCQAFPATSSKRIKTRFHHLRTLSPSQLYAGATCHNRMLYGSLQLRNILIPLAAEVWHKMHYSVRYGLKFFTLCDPPSLERYLKAKCQLV